MRDTGATQTIFLSMTCLGAKATLTLKADVDPEDLFALMESITTSVRRYEAQAKPTPQRWQLDELPEH